MFSRLCLKSNACLLRRSQRRSHQLSDRIEDNSKVFIVLAKLKHEALRKPGQISLYGLVEHPWFDFVKGGEIAINHHFQAAVDAILEHLRNRDDNPVVRQSLVLVPAPDSTLIIAPCDLCRCIWPHSTSKGVEW